jgi:hypothetical protein
VLADLVAAVQAGQSQVLVVRGEPGVGKTALLDVPAGRARGCRVVRAAGSPLALMNSWVMIFGLPDPAGGHGAPGAFASGRRGYDENDPAEAPASTGSTTPVTQRESSRRR